MIDKPYTCKDICGQEHHCNNKHCSAHPGYIPSAPKKPRKEDRKVS